ncbi:MAG: UvrB/UvrC motif-containing protein [Oscillospiraceae bacterium]|nr:UvrB/UvrC motif-containing protein [Oscillospiraceae bacterium]
MNCEKCNQHPATTHIKRMAGGMVEEFHLCAACAKASGLLPGSSGGFNLADLFGGLLGNSVSQQPAAVQSPRCGACGLSLQEIAQSGRMGCAACYDTFAVQIAPTLQRVHSSVQHTGKTPEDGNPALRERRERESTLTQLREQIAQAVQEENYEQAAALRDEIRALEQGGNDDA